MFLCPCCWCVSIAVTLDLRSALDGLETTLSTINENVRTLEQSRGEDFGPDGQFYKLKGQCFEVQIQKYVLVWNVNCYTWDAFVL